MAADDAQARPRRRGRLARRARGAGLPAAGDHRPRTSARTSRCTSARCISSSTARSTTTSSCATSCAGSVTSSRPRATPRFCCTPGPSGARARSTGSTACSPSRSGTTRAATLTLRRRPVRREAALLGAATASGSSSHPTTRRCSPRPDLGAAADDALARRILARGAMPPVERELLRRDTAAARPRTCSASATDARRFAATGARARRGPGPLRGRGRAAARAAGRLDPPAAARRRPGRHLAQRRHRLVGGRACCRRRLAGDHRRHAFTARSPASSATSGATRDEVARRGRGRRAHAVEPTADELLADLDALVVDQRGAVSARSSIYAQWRVMRARTRGRRDGAARRPGCRRALRRLPGAHRLGAARRRRARAVAPWRSRTGGGRRGIARVVALRLPAGLAWRAATPPDGVAVRLGRRGRRGAGGAIPEAAVVGGGGAHRRASSLRQRSTRACPQLLRYADRNSMAHSREVRLPFLDRRIAEFASRCPPGSSTAMVSGRGCCATRCAAVVPARCSTARDKIGFETPQAAWLVRA